MSAKNNSIILFLILSIALTISSCRSESDELIVAPDDQSLKANSKVANLMLRTSSNDGSIDDSIDNSECFSINLPFTITANGQEITFISEEDIEAVQDIFDESDEIIFAFPITVIFNDFSEEIIANTDEFNEIVQNCGDQDNNGNDDDDEHNSCIDFKFPFSASVFDSQSELITTVTFENDKDLYQFIDGLEETDITNLNFPITIILSEGTEITVSDLDNLENSIEEAITAGCDDDGDGGDDDVDDGDDDNDNANTDLSTENFSGILTDQTWEILKYKDNQSNETKNYKDFIFEFSDDGNVEIENEETENITNGIWAVTNTPGGILNINFDFGTETPLNKLNGNWNIKKAKENLIQLDQTEADGISKDQLFFKSI